MYIFHISLILNHFFAIKKIFFLFTSKKCIYQANIKYMETILSIAIHLGNRVIPTPTPRMTP